MRRLGVIWVLSALGLFALSNVGLQFLTGDGDGMTANSTGAKSYVVYNDTRPIGSNGYLCVFGAKGRLNNLILQNLVGIHMAQRLNRTLLVDPEVSKYYDIDRMSLGTFPQSPILAATPIGKSNYTCIEPGKISPYSINHGLNIVGRFDEYGTQTKGLPLASVGNSDIWYWLGRPPEDIYERFFRSLVPKPGIEDKVHAFMKEQKLRQNEFNAHHLRFFEGNCGGGGYDPELCCPKLDFVQQLLIERDGNLMDPLFVANDRQCPEDVLRTYTNATDRVIMGYNGPCDGTECAVIDFELCVRANIFVGNFKSSGDMNIREWRLARFNKTARTSVITRQKDILALEEKHKYVTRYAVGHWKFRPDCDQVGARQRKDPCV